MYGTRPPEWVDGTKVKDKNPPSFRPNIGWTLTDKGFLFEPSGHTYPYIDIYSNWNEFVAVSIPAPPKPIGDYL